jgi:uncharacterized protein YggE
MPEEVLRPSYAAMLAVAAMMLPTVAAADVWSQPPNVAVTATGTVYYEPDQASVAFTVSAHSLEPQTAGASVDQRGNGVVDALKQLGIPTKDVHTGAFVLDNNRYSQSQPNEYVAEQTITVDSVPISEISNLIAVARRAGADLVNGPYYTSSKQSELRDAALAKALDGAGVEAKKIAKHLGIKLGTPLYVTVKTGYDVRGDLLTLGTITTRASPNVPIPGPAVAPGQHQLSVTVDVSFAILR